MTLLHVALTVSDIEATADFYEKVLGYEVVREMDSDVGRQVFIGHPDPEATDDAALQLVPAEGPVDPGDFVHAALGVDDLDAALDTLDDDLIEDGPIEMPDAGVRVAFVEDLDGYGVELIEQL